MMKHTSLSSVERRESTDIEYLLYCQTVAVSIDFVSKFSLFKEGV